ncbi:MAG: response regulator, partial [Calditrichota bacterium]
SNTPSDGKNYSHFKELLKKLSNIFAILTPEEQEKARELISDILLTSRSKTSTKNSPKEETLNLLDTIKEIYGTILPYASTNNINLSIDETSRSCFASTDSNALSSFITDLLSQLILALPEGGDIKIRTDSTDLPNNKLLLEFYMVSPIICPSSETFLAELNELIRTLELNKVDSIEKGEYTEEYHTSRLNTEIHIAFIPYNQFSFKIYFERPKILTSLSPDIEDVINADSTEESESDSESGKKLVMVVEDSAEVRQYLYRFLSRYFIILLAENGAQAITMAGKTMPDLILSDVMMPEMDGIEFCRQLKTNEETSHIPVILLTAHPSVDTELEGLETGADYYITKPFAAKMLLARINNLLTQRESLKQRFSRLPSLEPSELNSTSTDAKFLQQAISSVEKHIEDPDFNTAQLAKDMNLSRSQLNRRLTKVTGKTSGEFIRTIRLNTACQLLEKKAGNVTEVADQVFFSSLSHFSKTFKAQVGVSPSDYRNGLRPDQEDPIS